MSASEAAVVFFSRDGSTRIVAEILAGAIDADLVELEEEQSRRGFLYAGFRAKTRKHSSLAGDPWSAIRDYRRIVLAAPIWAGSGNPAMNGFLDRADLRGKTVHILTLQADPRLSRSREVLGHYRQRVETAGGIVAGTRAIPGASPGRRASEEDLRAAVEGWLTE